LIFTQKTDKMGELKIVLYLSTEFLETITSLETEEQHIEKQISCVTCGFGGNNSNIGYEHSGFRIARHAGRPIYHIRLFE